MGGNLKMIIGGSASTGSTLLTQTFNRHSQIYCGPETNIFTKYELIDSWESKKHALLLPREKSFLPTSGWHLHNGHQLISMIDSTLLKKAVNQCNTYKLFIEYIFNIASKKYGKRFAVEKTPSNCVLFEKLIPIFQGTRFLLMVRHPIEAISSMVNRGWSPVYSTGLYLYNISMGWCNSTRLGILKYEDLVEHPTDALTGLMYQIELPFENEMLTPEDVNSPQSPITSWRFSEMARIEKGAGTFHSLSRKKQLEIINSIKYLRFKPAYNFHGIYPKFNNIFEIADQFGYNLQKEGSPYISTNSNWIYLHLYIEKFKRAVKKGAIGYFDFPFITNTNK